MQKKRIAGFPDRDSLRKLWKIMKLTIGLIIGFIMTVSANSYSQKTKLDVNLSNTTIKGLFEYIEQNSEFVFLYRSEDFNMAKRVDIELKEATINQILDQALKDEKVVYNVYERQIIIQKDVEPANTQQLQKKEISGIVKDTKGLPLPGGSVVVKGTTTGTVTDVNGKFSLFLPKDAKILVFSFVGMKAQEIAIGDKTTINLVMKEETFGVDEVVVVGYGQIKKSDATGSVLAIKPDGVNKGTQITAQDALVGKIAGVNVVPGSGAPGSGATIRIRMGSSLSASNDPLIVIDGVPVDNSSINGASNIISSINPYDIASFTILKDASATAIYGSRASNGVIIITTKKGNAVGNQKLTFNYNNNLNVSDANNYIDILSADEYRSAFTKYSSAPATFKLGSASTNWQKEIYRVAFSHEHNFSATGTTRNVPYRISLGYTNQDGIIKHNNYERFNAGVGLSPKFLDDHLSLDANFKGSYENNNKVSSGVVGSAISFDPTRPIRETYAGDVGLGYYTWMSGGAPIAIAPSNPIAEIELGKRLNTLKRSIGNVAVDYKFHGFEDLHLKANMGYDILKSEYSEMVPQFAPSMYISNQKDGRGKSYSSVQNKRNYLLDVYANYNKDFSEKHNFNAMVGYGWQHFWQNFNDETNDTFGNQLISPSHSESEYYLVSFYGRLNYSYAQKYLLTATLRTDASSRFSKENRWGYFPSVAAAWRINKENFLKDLSILSDLKFRLSYGQTGQQDIGSDYPYLSTYTASYDEARYQLGNKWYTTYRPNGYDPNIKWERTQTYNIGLDFGFLKNRVSGAIDMYKRNTKDLLNLIFVPAGSNFTNIIYTNIGNMENKGVEFALSAIPVKTKDWEWTINGNFTWNTSIITKLNTIDTDKNYVKTGNAGGTGKYLQIHKVGEMPYTYFLLKQAYDENGKPLDGKYIAKDGSITTSEEDANKYITNKSSLAPYYYGLSTKITYKDWDFGLNGHGSFGNYVFNYVAAGQSFDSFYSSQGTSGNIMRSTLETGFTQQRLYTDYFLEKASFFRLDNITLGYTIRKLLRSSNSMRLSFGIQNVFTLTNYTGLDPEIYNGIDNNIYQRPRVYMFGLNINF